MKVATKQTATVKPSEQSLAIIGALNRTFANRYGRVLFRVHERAKYAAVIDRTLNSGALKGGSK